MESAWHLDPQRFHIPPSPSPALRKGVILLKAIHHGLNQPINQFPFPTFWLLFVCAELRDKSCHGIHAIFPFVFLPELPVTGIFESNQTLLRLSQLSKVSTIDKVRTLQEHCPQRLPLNNQKPSPPSHDPLAPRWVSEAQDLGTSLKSAEPNCQHGTISNSTPTRHELSMWLPLFGKKIYGKKLPTGFPFGPRFRRSPQPKGL